MSESEWIENKGEYQMPDTASLSVRHSGGVFEDITYVRKDIVDALEAKVSDQQRRIDALEVEVAELQKEIDVRDGKQLGEIWVDYSKIIPNPGVET